MTPRATLFSVALVAGVLALPQATACIEVEPRHNVEFAEGSAEIAPEQLFKLTQMLQHSGHSAGQHRVSVRGYADRAGSFDAKTWRAEDLALADARARALSLAMRTVGNENCVERVALGAAASDAPPVRVDDQGRRWHTSAVLVLAAPGSHDTPIDGVSIETDCGPPKPEPVPLPEPKA
jgi:outer membrane protein OmpA-like peptidoglycan-associated protein